jgi:hypothetical protein
MPRSLLGTPLRFPAADVLCLIFKHTSSSISKRERPLRWNGTRLSDIPITYTIRLTGRQWGGEMFERGLH